MATINIMTRKADLISYTEAIDKEQFINEFIATHADDGVTEADHVYSLLLITAIVLDDVAAVEDVLSVDRGNILTTVDVLKYSAFSTMLYHGNKEILSEMKSYIANYIMPHPELRTKCHLGDEAHIKTIMCHPQFENLTKAKYIKLLKPLYLDITPFVEYLDIVACDCGY